MGDRARIPEEPESYLPLTPAVLDIMRLAPGTLYRSLKQMHERGLVEESEERPDPNLDDERRRYYRLTEFGWKVAVAELEGLVRAGRSKGLAPSPRPSGAGA